MSHGAWCIGGVLIVIVIGPIWYGVQRLAQRRWRARHAQRVMPVVITDRTPFYRTPR
jgi:hypothetical protein